MMERSAIYLNSAIRAIVPEEFPALEIEVVSLRPRYDSNRQRFREYSSPPQNAGGLLCAGPRAALQRRERVARDGPLVRGPNPRPSLSLIQFRPPRGTASAPGPQLRSRQSGRAR